MIENLRAMAMLATVVEEKSFQGAAQKLSVSAGVISQNIKALEDRLSCVLLDRRTRELRLTAQGEKMIRPARAILEAGQIAINAVQTETQAAQGKIIVSVLPMLSGGVLANIVEDFLLINPRVQMELRFESTQRHPIHDNVDLVVGLDAIHHKNVGLKDLLGGGGGFYAAPDLAERIERTETRDILGKIPILMGHTFSSNEWAEAFSTNDLELLPEVPFRMKCDDVSIIYRMCLSGAGLTVLPHSSVRDDVKTGRLVQVLKHISFEHTQFLAMWNKRSANSQIIENFLSHMEAALETVRRHSAQT